MLPSLRLDLPEARMRAAAMIEGVSYLVLLFIAMPLKYLGDMPRAVLVAGSIHGALFLWLMGETASAVFKRGKSLGWGVRVFVLSLIPFGTFWLDRELREEEVAVRTRVLGDE